MKCFPLLLAAALVGASTGPGSAQQQGPDALSRIFRHNNGTRTETQKMGGSDKIREQVFDKNNVLSVIREFTLDPKGRITSGMIYDGKRNALGSTVNYFDQQTGRMLYEEMKDAKGRLIRKLFYPGTLQDPKYAKRMVAFSYKPEDPKAAPREVAGKVRPIVPVTKNEDEFEPGIPQGTAAPTPQEAATTANRSRAAGGQPVKVPPRRFFLRQKPSAN